MENITFPRNGRFSRTSPGQPFPDRGNLGDKSDREIARNRSKYNNSESSGCLHAQGGPRRGVATRNHPPVPPPDALGRVRIGRNSGYRG
ncbi:unnamed protein product, partial [Iphiclides podalirius]